MTDAKKSNDKNKLKSEQILDELKKNHDERKQVQVDEETIQLIIIKLNSLLFALSAESVFEIGENTQLFSIPGAPSHVLGIQNLRGDIATILSIKVLLKLDNVDNGVGKRIIYGYFDDDVIGFSVDIVEDVIDFPLSIIKKTLITFDKVKQEFISGEISYHNQHIPMLNLIKIFERAKMSLSQSLSN